MSQSELKDGSSSAEDDETQPHEQSQQSEEYGGPRGKEPTRYGDWEKNGRCIDF